jgi:hypothetical protein
MPKEITRVKIPLLPLPANIPYYSFNGIVHTKFCGSGFGMSLASDSFS